MAYGALSSWECNLNISGKKIGGVTSVSPSFNRPVKNYVPLGVPGNFTALNGPITSELSISRNLIYTGAIYDVLALDSSVGVGLSGNVEHGGENLMFTDAYVTAFNTSCAVGEIPTVSNSIQVYGKFISGVADGSLEEVNGIEIPAVRNISLTAYVGGNDVAATNRVTNFSLQKTTKYQPIYSLAGQFNYLPEEVKHLNPIEVTATFGIELDDFQAENAYRFMIDSPGTNEQSFSINVQNFDGTATLLNVASNGFTTNLNPMGYLESQSLSVDTNDVVKGNLTYKWYEFAV
jgi:hypothetical protein